jgi:TetR/AcrR family fatty acid metabolism transcriptional regulator
MMNETSKVNVYSERMRVTATVTQLSRYQRRKEKTKQDILAAAKKVLAEKGYHHAKIIDIATAADSGVGTFYLHYPTKDALFLELITDTARLLKEDLDQARATTESAIEKLHLANRAFFRFAQDNREVLKIVFGHGNTFNALLRQIYAMFVTDAEERISDGITRAEFRSLPSPVIANALVGMAAQVVSWWIDQPEPSAEDMATTLTDFMLRGMAHDPQRAV